VPIIDADAHVIETDRTWDFLAESDCKFRPSAVVARDPQAQGRFREFWRIGDRVVSRRAFDVECTGTTAETQELSSIEARLAHMDQLGVIDKILDDNARVLYGLN